MTLRSASAITTLIPALFTVPVGSTVTWQWNSGGVAHNVTFQNGPASQNLSSGT
jgi:plastocyanin